MKGSDDVFYLCDECDALWPAEQFDWDNYTVGLTDRASALEARGLSADDLRPVLKDLSLFETAGEDYRLVMYYDDRSIRTMRFAPSGRGRLSRGR